MNDYYAALGVERTATAEEIKRAYLRKARRLHPDVNPGHEEEFKEVGQAYEVLGDEEKRRSYDAGVDPFGDPAQGMGFGGGAFSFTDIMDAFFGGASGGRGPVPRRQRGNDALVRHEVPLQSAVFGSTEELALDTAVVCATCEGEGSQPGTGRRTCDVCRGAGQVQQVQRSLLGQVMTTRPCAACAGHGDVITSPCFECSGDGRVRTRRTLRLKVPAGVDTGTRIALAGEGEVGPGGGPAGDLYVEVRVLPDDTFTREGDDLHCSLTLPMTAAALGTTVTLETFDGPQEVDVPAGTQVGEVFTLEGLGVGRLRREGRGDLRVHADVRVPTRLDDRQRELLRELASVRGEERPDGRLAGAGEDGGFLGRLRRGLTGR